MPLGREAESSGPKAHILDGVHIPNGKGQFSGVVRPTKKHRSLCCGVRKNGSTDRDAVWDDSCEPKEPHNVSGQGRANPFASSLTIC